MTFASESQQLVQLASTIARCSGKLLADDHLLSTEHLATYLSISQSRVKRWLTFFDEHHDPQVPRSTSANLRWIRWAEEVLLTEMLTRIWTALATAHDARRHRQDFEPVVRSVFEQHVECRNRILREMLGEERIRGAALQRLDGLRRRVERWTDMLMGYMQVHHDIREFAFSPHRTTDYAGGLFGEQDLHEPTFVWPLVSSALRNSFADFTSHDHPNAELTAEISASLCLRFGAPRRPHVNFPVAELQIPEVSSLWQERMLRVAQDAAGLLDELMADNG